MAKESSFDVLQDFLDTPRGGGDYLKPNAEGEYHVRLLTDPGLILRGRENRFCALEISYLYKDFGGDYQIIQSPKTWGEDDPLGEIKKDASAAAKKAFSDWKQFSTMENFFFPVLECDGDGKGGIKGFRIMQADYKLASEIMKLINAPDYKKIGEDSIADIEEGHHIKITCKMVSKKREYTVLPYRKPLAIDEDWYEDMTDIMANIEAGRSTFDAVEAFLEKFIDDMVEEDAPVAKKKPAAKSAARPERGARKARKEVEPEEPDEEEEEEDDDPEEKPTRKRAARTSRKKITPKPDPEDDEPEEEEESEEEEEAPEEIKKPERKRKSRAKKPEPEPEKEEEAEPEPEEEEEEEVPPATTRRGRSAKKIEAEPAAAPASGRSRPKRKLL